MSPQRGRFLSIAVLLGAVAAVVLAIVFQGVQDAVSRQPLPGPSTTALALPSVAPLAADEVRVLAAGDIGRCGSAAAAATGALLDAIPDATVLALGDQAYERGTSSDYADCYLPVWGAALTRTIPVPGNHEYLSRDAAGYFETFGAAAGTAAVPWRVTTLGAWRLYALDSECDEVGGCGDGSAQLTWLQRDLAANPTACILATWHRPRFSSGPHGPNTAVDPLWRALAGAGADLVLNGHEHLYERFAPLDADGTAADPGLRELIVGTGGDNLYTLHSPAPGSEVRWDRTFGVLELVLRPGGYDWRFHAVMGEPFEDAGSGTC